jgi:hypothetical protein
MEISEQELRAMIREAIARHAGGGESVEMPVRAEGAAEFRVHASHGMFLLAPGGDGECIIEPSVRCNHCGFCKSFGH